MRVTAIRQFTSVAHNGSAGLCGPAVRLLIQHYGIEESQLKGTGPKQNILKEDVLSLVKVRGLKPIAVTVAPPKQPEGSPSSKATESVKPQGSVRNVEKFIDIPLSSMRTAIARRLSQSKLTTPHQYQSIDVNSDSLLKFRRQLKNEGTLVSLNDFIVKAAAMALKAVPELNVQWTGESVKRLPSVDVSVAVATSNGLITPIVTNADILGVRAISQRVKELSQKARDNKLQLHEFQGGSFTISNLGMFGSVDRFTAIINPPQAAILTIGGNKAVLNDDLKLENRFVATLCYDVRAISEEAASSFLMHFSRSLSDPDWMVAEPVDDRLGFDITKLL